MYALFIISVLILHIVFSKPCIPRKYDQNSIVCVCNKTYCDTYEKIAPLKEGSYMQYVSSLAGLRLHRSEGTFKTTSENFFTYEILIAPLIEYQHIFGFGSHFNDATGEVINSLPAETQRRLLSSYWSDQGSEYSMARVPIGGTDFSPRYYTYMDKYEDGMQLIGFNLTVEDHKLKIPHILTAKNISHHPIRFIATPWTAPAWMKTSNHMVGGELKSEYYQAYADYYLKFLDSYRSNGIDFWGLTTGNEPSNGFIPRNLMPLPSMVWNTISAAKWMKQNFGPTIRHSEFKNINIMIHDDQRTMLPATQLYCMDNEAMQYPNGIATHLYADQYTPELMLLLARCPNKEYLFALMTEGTAGIFDPQHVRLGNWQRAEYYIDSIITYMYYHFSGWLDWNQALNTDGGPNLTGFNVDSCIIINATAGEFYKQPTFYAMAHFSKFVPPGSIRIDSHSNGKLSGIFLNINHVAFKRPDGGIVVILHNKVGTYAHVDVKDEIRGQIKLTLKPNSVTTILYW